MSTSSASGEARAAWHRFCDQLRAAGDILVDPRAPTDDQTQGYGLNYLANLLNSGLEMMVMTADGDHPEIGRPQDATKKWGLDCPDALYSRATIDGQGSYVIKGWGGNPHYLGVSINTGLLGTDQMRTLHNTSSPGPLPRDAGGGFELAIAPATEGEVHVSVRQFFNDWERETPLRLSIERTDRPAEGLSFAVAQMADRLDHLGAFVAASVKLWPDFVDGLRQRCYNSFAPPNLAASVYGGTPDNVYGSGYFELLPDQAAIIEVAPPPCHFWNIQFGSYWFESLDFVYRQSSLNGHQAQLTADGRLIAVLAHRDPGVWNWFDTASNRVVTATYRWQLIAGDREAAPAPAARIVPFDDLDRELPARTPRISPVARAEQLAARRRGALRRYGR